MLTKGKSPFDPAKIFQVGIVVKSVDETVKFYQEVFGIGVGEMLVPRQLTDGNSWHSARRGIRQVASESPSLAPFTKNASLPRFDLQGSRTSPGSPSRLLTSLANLDSMLLKS